MKKKRFNVVFVLFMVFLFPISYFTFNKYINFDTMSAIVFIVVVAFLIIKNRKVLDFQPILKIMNIPLIYAVLWKTKFGIKFMDKIASKYREIVKLIGYCFIGFGFFGMIFISINILIILFNLFVTPAQTSQNFSLILPLTNIPGVGYLSFWHFLIALFLTVLVHEFAHGIVARAHNVPIKSSGLGVFALLVPLFPLAFVEPSEKKLLKESDIVQYSIFSAGPMLNIILAAVVLLLTAFVMIPIENNITHPMGLSFGALMDNYSAQEAGMEAGMVINEVNGVEVLDYQSFSDEIGELKPEQELVLGTLNGTFTIVTKSSPDDSEKGYIGILQIRNERRINNEYALFGGFFFWLRGLLKWLYFINVGIGLMNLLPLMITDGGRMLKIALERMFKDSKKADKVWLFIGIVFIFTLLFAMVVKYSLSLFSLLG